MSATESDPGRGCLLLTGASSGLGREMAIHLSASRRLILNGRDQGRLEDTLARCAPGGHVVWNYDLANLAGLDAALSALVAGHDLKVAEFIHCAAVLKILPLKSIPLEMTLATLATNLVSAMEISRVLTRKKTNQGALRSIVFISSIASKFGAKGFTAYCASKGALDAFMKALAVELAPAVRVNSVLPGGIKTEMTEAIFADPELVARFQRDYPLGLGAAADVIAAVEFLLSPQSRWVTGQQLVVDGGRTANITA